MLSSPSFWRSKLRPPSPSFQRGKGGPSSLVSFPIRVLSSVLSYLSRGSLPSSREARGGHHLSCYYLLFSPHRASREVVSLVFSSPLRLYNKREERTDEKTREENRMRGCPPFPPPSLPLQKRMKRPQGANIRYHKRRAER